MAGHARSVSMAGPSPAGRRPQARKLVADPRNNRISEMPGRLLPPQAMALRGGFRTTISRYRWTSRDVYHSIKVTAYLPGTLYNTVTKEISKSGLSIGKRKRFPRRVEMLEYRQNSAGATKSEKSPYGECHPEKCGKHQEDLIRRMEATRSFPIQGDCFLPVFLIFLTEPPPQTRSARGCAFPWMWSQRWPRRFSPSMVVSK